MVLTAQQLNAAKNLKQKFSILASINDPESLLKMSASNNPLVNQLFTVKSQYPGMGYDDITAAILTNKGYDANAVREQLKSAGII